MPKIEERIVITSGIDLQHHFDSVLPALQLTETEDSWQKIEKSLIKLEVITKSGGYKHDNFSTLFKSVAQPIINSLLSERTKLSGTAADLLNSVAPRLGEKFESLIHVFAPTLLLICARTNKVALVRAKKCLLLIAKHCKLPSLLTHLRDASKDKSQTMRVVSVEVTLMLLEAVDNKEKIGRRVADIEIIVRGTATDRDPEVRQWCKRVFEMYVDWWPERVNLFTSSFTPTTRRYLALPKTNLSASATLIPQKATVTPFKRAELSKSQHTSAAPNLKASVLHTASKNHPSTSYAASTSSTAQSHQSSNVRLQGNTRVQSASSSSSASSSRGTQPAISITEVNQQSSRPAIESEDDKKRAALRAEILKQATGTPSQSIAARLALQQLDFQLKKSQKASAPERDQEEVIKRQTDRALFNIAMAKKKQSPLKGPSRIVVTAPPPTTLQKTWSSNDVSKKPAQRIVSTASSTSSLSKGKKADDKVEEEPDVFRSRPIEKAVPLKMTSSISRGLSAREKLLKTSSLKPSSPMANRGMKAARGPQTNKKIMRAPLKVDIGKENIPPNSVLASIAQSADSELPRSRIVPSRLIAGTIAAEAIKVVRPFALEKHENEAEIEIEPPQEEREESDNSNGREILGDGEVDCSPPLEEAHKFLVKEQEPSLAPVLTEKDSALDDWKEVVASLPSEEQQQDIIPHSAPSNDFHSNDVSSSPMQKVVIAPFMSTPARKTLGEILYNVVSPLSLSSPLFKKIRQGTMSTSKANFSAPTLEDIKEQQPPKPKNIILAPSRKM